LADFGWLQDDSRW